MVWREAYSTRVLDAPSLSLPELKAYDSGEPFATPSGTWVWLAGPDLKVQLKLGVWLRLLDSLKAPPARVISTWSGHPAASDKRTWAAVVPRSQQALWTSMDANPFEIDAPLIAAAMHGSHAEIVMLGAPTEEAWDAFQEALARAEARGR